MISSGSRMHIMRNILLVARELQVPATELDLKQGRYVPVNRDAHKDIEEEISLYGKLDTQRTSGILPRMQTPPEGIHIESVFTDPASHPATLQAIRRQQEEHRIFLQTLFTRIERCDHLVVVRDGYSDLRGAIVMFAHMRGKPILSLQRYSRKLEPPYEPLYEIVRITNIRFEEFSEAKQRIREYFNHHPLPMAG